MLFGRRAQALSEGGRRARSRLVWFPDAQGAAGYAVPFRRIVMHAISRGGARPCIFAQIEGAAPGSEQAAAENEEEGEEGEQSTELRLVPADEAAGACCTGAMAVPTLTLPRACGCAVETLFRTMCDVAAMNPDPEAEGVCAHARRHSCILAFH